MFRIGQQAVVTSLTDETALPEYLGLAGEVVHFDYNCGCGQTYPSDPMIGVQFPNDVLEEFWSEELSILAKRGD